MKKTLYIFASFTTVLFSSCAKEADVKDDSLVTGTTLRASVEGVDTKVSANAAGVYKWQASDKIAVLDDAGDVYEFSAASAAAASEFSCASSITLGDYAQYPYSASFTAIGDDVAFYIPKVISYATDATNMPMLGKISGDVVTFKAVGGLLRLIVYGVPADATELEFAAKNKKINGEFEIADASVESPVIATAAKGSGDNTISIDFSGKRSDNMVFYIPLPTGTIDGFDITFNDSALTSKSSSKNLAVSRNDIIWAPVINLTTATVMWKETFTNYAADTKFDDAAIQTSTGYDAIAYNSASITYKTVDGTTNTCVATGNSAGGTAPELIVNKGEGTFTASGIPTMGETALKIEFKSNGSNISLSSSSTNVTISGTYNASNNYSGTISNPNGLSSINIQFKNTSSSNIRIDDIVVSFDPMGAATPFISYTGSNTKTISAGSLNASINGVTLNNPLDGTGIAVVSDVDWLNASLNAGIVTITATGYNHDEDAREGHITLKATGAASKEFTVTQNPSVVSSPSLTGTPGNATFTISWTGDGKAKSYIGYYGTSALDNPTNGTALSITNEGTAYTATPSATVTNGTKYYIYVKVNEVADASAAKYVASSVWSSVQVTPVDPAAGGGSDDFYTVNANGSYSNRTTTAGWNAVNTAVVNVTDASASDANHRRSFTMNGKTTAVGVITSPSLTGGVGSLSLRYQNTFSESNGASFKIEIKQGSSIVWTQTVTNASVTQSTGYPVSFSTVNVSGTFQIIITNLCPSNTSSSNKDRLSIYDIQWTGYPSGS